MGRWKPIKGFSRTPGADRFALAQSLAPTAAPITGFARSTGLRCPSCGGGDLEWLATEGQPMPNPVTVRCACGHRWNALDAAERSGR